MSVLPDHAKPLARGSLRPARSSLLAIELGLLLGAWLLLLALGRERPTSEAAPQFLPPLSWLAAVASACLAPGFMLWRLVERGSGWAWVRALPFSFGLGMAWLMLPAAVVLRSGGNTRDLTVATAALHGLLLALYGVVRLREKKVARPAAAAQAAQAGGGWWLLGAAAVLALVRLLYVASRSRKFTYGGDEWVLMASVRYFLEARAIAVTWDFDVWGLVTALFVRLAHVELIDAYRLWLPSLLIVMASLAFLSLADALFRNRGRAAFAFALYALFALSDMQPRGEGAGMAVVVRVMEDKYAALTLAVPLAQAAFVLSLRSRSARWAFACGALSLLAVALNPMSLVWLGLPFVVVLTAGVATRRLAASRISLGVAAGLLLAVASALYLRAQRPASYFEVHAPEWPFSEVLRGLSRGQLLILDLEGGLYMLHPQLLRHPLVLASIVSALLLLPRLPRSLSAQFLVGAMLGPVLLGYNPLTAPLLGAWVTPWLLYRILWTVSVPLVIAAVAHPALTALEGWLRRKPGPWRRAGIPGLASVAALALLAATLAERMEASWWAMKARNRIAVKPAERELMRALSRDQRLSGAVLAPVDLSIRLPAWTSRLTPLPGLAALRYQKELVGECARFHAAAEIGPQETALLTRLGVRYVVAEAGTPIEAALRRLPSAFRPLHTSGRLTLFEWRPDRWSMPVASPDHDIDRRRLAGASGQRVRPTGSRPAPGRPDSRSVRAR